MSYKLSSFRIVRFLVGTLLKSKKPYILLFGPGGDGKSPLVFKTLRSLNMRFIYRELPLTEEEIADLWKKLLILLGTGHKIILVLDEFESLGTNTAVIGWVKKMMDLATRNNKLRIIGITNRPWLIKTQYPDLWRRILDDGEQPYYTDPPLTPDEMMEIIGDFIEEIGNQHFNFQEQELQTIAIELARDGWNYKTVKKLFQLIIEKYGAVTLELVRKYKAAYETEKGVPFSPQVIEDYIFQLQRYKIPHNCKYLQYHVVTT